MKGGHQPAWVALMVARWVRASAYTGYLPYTAVVTHTYPSSATLIREIPSMVRRRSWGRGRGPTSTVGRRRLTRHATVGRIHVRDTTERDHTVMWSTAVSCRTFRAPHRNSPGFVMPYSTLQGAGQPTAVRDCACGHAPFRFERFAPRLLVRAAKYPRAAAVEIGAQHERRTHTRARRTRRSSPRRRRARSNRFVMILLVCHAKTGLRS